MGSHTELLTRIAQQIANGEYDAAIISLSDSLARLKAEFIEMVDESINYENDVTSAKESFEIAFHAEEASFECDDPSLLKSCHEEIPVFCKPLVVRCVEGVAVPPETLSFVAMYNLALSYHLKSSCEDTKDVLNLQKAASLYEYSHEVFQSQMVSISPVHLLTLVANLANIHEALGEEEKSNVCLQHVLSIYMFIVDSGDGKGLPSSIIGFLRSILLHILPKVILAPAA